MQLYSFAYHWNDTRFRNALFTVGMEEGLFYEPTESMNPFVVVAIRNSLLETIQSVDYQKTGLSYELDNQSIKSVTGQAIRYFSDKNMESACNGISIKPSEDLYGRCAKAYPLAWEALLQIGNTNAQAVRFSTNNAQYSADFFDDFEMDTPLEHSKPFKINILDGYSLQIDEELKKALYGVALEGRFFFSESFKAITRNFEKLLRVMEYVLYHKKPFVTCNYYITNGYVARRSIFLKPAHTTKDFYANISNLNNLRKAHRDAIQIVIDSNREAFVHERCEI